MLYRIRSLLSRLVFLLLPLAAVTLAGASSPPEASSEKQSDEDGGQSPRFVLVEEHHHVVSHLMDFAREGFLRSHINKPTEERNPHGAILIHIDSHADMGLTPGLNNLPAETIFSNLPAEKTKEDLQLLEHSVINDFLLLLGYTGIVDHIIFVEPPWSLLFYDAHYTTVDISFGVVPGNATYGSIRNSPLTTFSREELSEDAIQALTNMMSDDEEPVEIVSHEELLQYCPTSSDRCKLRTVQFTTIPYHGAGEAIQEILELTENHDRDIVLDVDLDGFSTTSPGAQSLFETTIPDYGVLTRIYHTVHSTLCDMGEDYWKQFKTSGSSTETNDGYCDSQDLSFVQGPSFRPSSDDDVGSLAYQIVSARARRLVNKLYDSMDWDMDIVQALAEVFEYYLPAIDATVYDDDEFAILIDGFLTQPFFVPEPQTIDPIIDFHFDELFQVIFVDNRRAPKVINVVRSPFYTPDHHLDFIECTVFERLLEMFGKNSTSSPPTLYHADEIHVDRTNCLHEYNKFPHSNRISTGTNPYETELWKSTNIVYSLFYEDDDDSFGTDYKYGFIDVNFTNQHEYSLLVKKSNDGQTLRVLPGESLIDQKVFHLTRWELFRVPTTEQTQSKSSFLTIVFNGKHGDQQSYGSVTGRMLEDNVNGNEL